MAQEELKNRADVPEELTWDLTALYETREDFDAAVAEMKRNVEQFCKNYEGKLGNAATIIAALKDYETIMQTMTWTHHYAFLPESADITDPANTELSRQMNNLMAEISAQLSFFDSELVSSEASVLDQVAQEVPQFASYIRHTKENKQIQLDPAVEKALAQLEPTLDAAGAIYEQARLADMDFGTFTVAGKEYPLSFVLYEDYYMYHSDTAIRRAAFDKFSETLSHYQNVVAEAYYTQVQKEKTMATMRGFDSVFDYLLYDQEVDQDLYNRQIDTIMEDLAPVMQKYITHVKEVSGLDKMTYADLKIDLDPEYAVEVTVEQSKEIVEDALSTLGQDYVAKVMQAYPERWVDFVQNKGKSTGGFCTSPYGKHPYILMSWSNQLSDVYTFIHEIGHAGQGLLAAENNSILGENPSLYLIEAPSTFNELLLTDSLARKSDHPRMERFALTNMLTNTYFHNFITHLLEAAYQREVYKLIDAGKGFDAAKLSELKRAVLEQFWGDAVEINPGAELTWMRQIHYYMGLYSYTYSAGLTIATQAFLRIKAEGQPAVAEWLEFLAMGDQYKPAEAAKKAGVDITTDKPLNDTIHYLDESVNKIIELSGEIEE
ncbi:MAG: oligoendopeptidase F [Carnobacterium sp.]|uniref:Oligopeptidase F n=1 Tax=Carnobacterium antarcticum TaxID=2126436 RepID=A0ABW4NKB0_9LACT|nr:MULTISPECIES: oligoendopeptidase F [unclassified Carnobacterium]ALV21997.1 Oligoendopeptidase F [Carnobacterium sp. CP1]QQP69963.1 oligoendopeptidase F [Carnobacterium sp. CS13]